MTRTRRRAGGRSPVSLPPRWGEGVAPPSTPHFSPETSPLLVNSEQMQTSPDSDHNSLTRSHHPTSGAELLDDLHRRLLAQSVNGTLPRRPKSSEGGRLGGRRLRQTTSTTSNRQKTNNYWLTLPVPDLVQPGPESAFNHPSRHTQYSLVRPSQQSSSQRQQRCSPSPTNSESPPLPPLQPSHLSFPSPPLVRLEPALQQPLTSTMLASPESSSSQSSQLTLGHANSPASPELSTIQHRLLNVTPYQNIQAGIAYVPSQELPVANLSRFNVSPPNSAVTAGAKSAQRLPARAKLKSKSVSWLSDRKLKAKHISADRKIVKSQVWQLVVSSQSQRLLTLSITLVIISSNISLYLHHQNNLLCLWCQVCVPDVLEG